MIPWIVITTGLIISPHGCKKKDLFMPQSLSKIILHIVFSTQDRRPLICNVFKDEMHAYLAAMCKSLKSHAIKVGGTLDHIHIAATLPRTVTVSTLLEEIKKSSSKWFKGKDERLYNFAWQAGYGVFSVGQSQLNQLIKYIEQQEEHHRKETFHDELRRFLEKYEVEYDEHYIWD